MLRVYTCQCTDVGANQEQEDAEEEEDVGDEQKNTMTKKKTMIRHRVSLKWRLAWMPLVSRPR